MGKINLEELNDLQKTWLTQISYLNISAEGRKKISDSGLLVSELPAYIEDANIFFVGDGGLNNNLVEKLTDKVLGKNQFFSKADIVESLLHCGLGNLTITHVSEEKSLTSSGFQALTFIDSYNNIGISYRGSDFELSKGGFRDWLEADMLEYFTGTSTQIKEALAYFNAHKNCNGNNFLYGHSLGGNLTSHTFVENYEKIKQAFTINGNPINQKLIDTPEKVAAFNNSKKFQCNIICGDIVGLFKSCEIYKNNVTYIHNNSLMNKSFVSAHLVQAASYDELGNFIKSSEEEARKQLGQTTNLIVKLSQETREKLNKRKQENPKD